jgi:tetratricopeptide (TPR) repeat protein
MKTGARCFFILLLLNVALFLASCRNVSGGRGASISEKKESIKTYPFSDPDPVPVFARSSMWGQGARLYPYFFFNTFSAQGMDKDWTVVRLENPYIQVSVLPQVGGKIWGASEKATGRDFLYTNHVLKFREIALRGPWTSGGIEFNFGVIGHAPSTATPVDYLLRKNKDGSVSCVVGALDLPSRTRWSVTITLPKDKSYFETNALWFNASPYSQSSYSWSCAAIKAADDLKYIFPGGAQIGHDYSVPLEPWPVDRKGRDLSWYKNNDFGGAKSYFTVGEYQDFYGAWYKNSDSGFGHWALYDDVPGRKIWIWDLSRAGEIWADLLTDKDGQYSEPQAGRLYNQSDHESFKPYSADRWREIWFPYRDIGPMVKASPAGVLNVTPSENALDIGFFPLQALDEDLTVTEKDGKEIFREHLKLSPGRVFKKSLPITTGAFPFEVRLGRKLVYKSDPKSLDIKRPLRFRPIDESTAEGLFLSGSRSEKARDFQTALQKYLACLEIEPLHVRALTRTAELYARRGEYVKAMGFVEKALEISMYDAEANYVYGVICRKQGELVDAKETLGWAARSMEYRSSAYAQLAEISYLEKDFEPAVEYGKRAIDFNALNLNAREALATTYRAMKQRSQADKELDLILAIDPLDHLARFERYLLEPGPARLEEFKSMVRCELPHETYLEMALYYVRLGAVEDAVTLLRNAPEQPEVIAWLAWLLREKSPDESRAYLEKAFGLSPWLVFPFREESIPVFEHAIASLPRDWKPKYYLGLIYWGKGRIEEARDLFAMCDGADFAPFYLTRGALCRDTDPVKSRADYVRAIGLDEKSRRSRHALIEFDLELGHAAQALETSRKAAALFPSEVPIRVDLVKSLMASDGYEEAAGILEGIEALPYEGAGEIHTLYVTTHVRLALDRLRAGDWSRAVECFERSKQFPEKLGTGAPFDPDLRLQDYAEAFCYEKMGEKGKEEACRKAVLEYTLRNWPASGPNAYLGGLILQRAGEKAKAGEVLSTAKPSKEIIEILKAIGQ